MNPEDSEAREDQVKRKSPSIKQGAFDTTNEHHDRAKMRKTTGKDRKTEKLKKKSLRPNHHHDLDSH